MTSYTSASFPVLMPSILRRRYRQSLRLDQASRQILESKLAIPTNSVVKTMSSSSQALMHSRSNSSKRRPRAHSRLPSRSPTATRFRTRRSNTSIHSQVPGAVLPVELLLRIFHLGAELCYEFPVVVSQVCYHWRFLALRSPKLWQVIRPDGRQVLCARRIRRSRGCPLDVHIAISPKLQAESSTLVDVHSRMACVLPAVRQWRSLSIKFDVYSPFLWNSALSVLCTESSRVAPCVPELESISLVYPANDDSKEFHLFGDCAPKLRTITLHGIRLRWTSALFENLASLDYTHHGFTTGQAAIQEVLAMLFVSRERLRTLSIRFPKARETGYSDEWFPPIYGSVDLPRLEKLIIRAEAGSNLPKELTKLISRLLLPSVITLELDVVGDAVTLSRKAVKSVVMPFWRHPRIERLIVREAWNHTRCIDAFVRSLPNLLTIERM